MKLIQLTGTETLGIRLGGAVSTNDPTFVVEYHDETPDNIISYSAKGETNGTSYVELVAASEDGYTRVITEISIVNVDDKTHIVNLLKVDEGDEYPLFIRSVEINGEIHLSPSTVINVQSGGDSLWEADGEAGVKPKSDKTVDYQYIVNGPSTTDEKIKYNALDAAAGYLADKVKAGTGISLAEGTGGDADKLVINNSLPSRWENDGETAIKPSGGLTTSAGYLSGIVDCGIFQP